MGMANGEGKNLRRRSPSWSAQPGVSLTAMDLASAVDRIGDGVRRNYDSRDTHIYICRQDIAWEPPEAIAEGMIFAKL